MKKMIEEKMCEEKEKIRLEAIKEMEMQLHEQFSVNYNSTYSTTITLFCSLLAVLYGYGYIFLNSSIEFAKNPGEILQFSDSSYSLDSLIYATIAANIVLAIIKYICLCQGVNQRLDQFIVHSIRMKYYQKDPTLLDDPLIFPKGYKPFGKQGDKIVVGMYGELIPIISALQILVLLGFLYKFIWNIVQYFNYCFIANAYWEIVFLAIITILCYGQYNCLKKDLFEKYKDRASKYDKKYVKYKL